MPKPTQSIIIIIIIIRQRVTVILGIVVHIGTQIVRYFTVVLQCTNRLNLIQTLNVGVGAIKNKLHKHELKLQNLCESLIARITDKYCC